MLFAPLFLVGCEGVDEPSLRARRTDPLYVNSTVVWDKGESIDVCFDAGTASADRTAAMAGAKVWQSIINIKFVAIGTCPGSGFRGIRIGPKPTGS